MNRSLEEFLLNRTPIAIQSVSWSRAAELAIELDIAVYVTTDSPPDDLTTSVRAIVRTDAGYALLSNADGVHVLPGGRREPAETVLETLAREVLEETGCTVREAHPLAALHFHHRTPRPVDYAFPYPDFVQAVYAVRGERDAGFGGDPEGYEHHVEFVAPAGLERSALPAYQRELVARALLILG
jgi:8-oxo-dGTP pyrophosphatase MutT (NUDIX family)